MEEVSSRLWQYCTNMGLIDSSVSETEFINLLEKPDKKLSLLKTIVSMLCYQNCLPNAISEQEVVNFLSVNGFFPRDDEGMAIIMGNVPKSQEVKFWNKICNFVRSYSSLKNKPECSNERDEKGNCKARSASGKVSNLVVKNWKTIQSFLATDFDDEPDADFETLSDQPLDDIVKSEHIGDDLPVCLPHKDLEHTELEELLNSAHQLKVPLRQLNMALKEKLPKLDTGPQVSEELLPGRDVMTTLSAVSTNNKVFLASKRIVEMEKKCAEIGNFTSRLLSETQNSVDQCTKLTVDNNKLCVINDGNGT